jgi:hypothetical protein
LGIWLSLNGAYAGKPARPEMLEIERKIAATAALDQPGGERAALWQR